MNEFKIEKNIPIPVEKGGFARGHMPPTKYPWREMEIGDSFFAPSAKRSNLHRCARAHGIRVAVGMEGSGFRVWRVK